MTALNCFVTHDAAHLFTDGAIYAAATGAVGAIGTKVIQVPHLNAVFGYSGMIFGGELVKVMMAEFNPSTFDDLAGKLGPYIKDIAGRTASLPNWPRSFDGVDIILAGWSEQSGKPEAWLLNAGAHEGRPPFTVQQITRHQMPLVDPVFKFNAASPETSGRSLMDGQRRMKAFPTLPGSQHLHIYGVGGFAQHTEVRKDQITSTIIRRWVDPVGQPINPFSEANGYRKAD